MTHAPISARIPREHAYALADLARENGRSFSAELRVAIRRYLALVDNRSDNGQPHEQTVTGSRKTAPEIPISQR